MNNFRTTLLILYYTLINILLCSFVVCDGNDENSNEGVQLFNESYFDLNNDLKNSNIYSEICRSCNCDKETYPNANTVFELHICSKCHDLYSNDNNCVYNGIKKEAKKFRNKYSEKHDPSSTDNYRTIFYGESNILTSSMVGSSLLSNMFKPEFVWLKRSPGEMIDNCILYRDSNDNSEYYNMKYIYTIRTNKNCASMLVHFVNKYSGKTIAKNQNLFSNNFDNNDSLIVIKFEDVQVDSRIGDELNIHQDYNITYYNVPPKYLFSKERHQWIPVEIYKPKAEINPNILLDQFFILFQLDKEKITSPTCKLNSIKVDVAIQCVSVKFPPRNKYTKDFVEKKLDVIYSNHKDHFNIFANELKKDLHLVLTSISNALFNTTNKDNYITPLNNLSQPCRESLYYSDVPNLMSKYNYSMYLFDKLNPDSYILSDEILEDREENELLDRIEKILGNN